MILGVKQMGSSFSLGTLVLLHVPLTHMKNQTSVETAIQPAKLAVVWLTNGKFHFADKKCIESCPSNTYDDSIKFICRACHAMH